MVLGTGSTLLLIYLSPTLQIDVLKHTEAWFPLRNPALVTMPLSFGAGILVSLLAPRPKEAAGFDAVSHRMHLGHPSTDGVQS
jgi:cation/acetate symporter